VRRAYLDPDNPLRASMLRDPAGSRINTKDNTPAVVHFDLVPGETVDVRIAAKGGGSENKAKFAMLNPSDSIVDWVLATVPTMGAGWCPPGMLGIGIGGSAEKAMVLAKDALMQPIDMHALKRHGASTRLEELRIEIYDKVNALGIGAQGLGGLSTVLDVKYSTIRRTRRACRSRSSRIARRHATRISRSTAAVSRRSQHRISPIGPTCTGRPRPGRGG
jgi:fumarate hydratase class I